LFKINTYFDGKVMSLAFHPEEGPATVGVLAPGEYEFGTESVEIMSVVAGRLTVQLPGEVAWKDCLPGDSFTVQANEKFRLRVAEESAYLCRYR
jgi:hypothetical protein